MIADITGTLEEIGDAETVGKYRKIDRRRCVVSTSGGYIPIDFVFEQLPLLDNWKVGDRVSIACSIESRKWVNPKGITQYFISLKGHEITKL